MSNALIAVPFHNQSLLATLVDGVPHVAMKPICENIGLDWSSQAKKISRHPVLKSTMVMMTMVAEDGKLREMVMLPIKYLNGWLFGVDSSRVKPEIKSRVIEYQTECFEVLANHFMPKQTEQPFLPEPDSITKAQTGLLFQRVNSIAGSDNKMRAAIWSRFSNHFNLNSYKDLPFAKFDEANQYLNAKLEEYRNGVELMWLSKTELAELVTQQTKQIEGEVMPALEQPQNCITLQLNKNSGANNLTLKFDTSDDQFSRFFVCIDSGNVLVRPMGDNEEAHTQEEWLKIMKDRGYLVIKKSEVVGKLLA